MVKKLVAFIRDENNEDFFCEGFYHTILFVIVYVLYPAQQLSTNLIKGVDEYEN
uniref:hypothetical protein n=1 Tax=Lactococcus lactis TaxID=1358 RepID=UPI00155DAE16|nr:hypothetical protein [Lactococcus lactis]